MHNLKIKLVVDAEADLYYHIPSPHFSRIDMIKWRLNKIAGRWFRYPWPPFVGLISLMECFKRYKCPATLCIAGYLYQKDIRIRPYAPENKWYKNKIGDNWYYWDTGDVGMMLGSVIEQEKYNPLFTFGLHGFAHEALTLERKEVIDSIIRTGIDHAEKLGIKINSFAAPFELTEDVSDPKKVYEVLADNNIKEVVYSGVDDGLTIKRFFDIKPVVKEDGLKKVWISNYIEGTSSKQHVDQILADIWANKDKDAVYALVMHDFTQKTTANVERVIRFIQMNDFEAI
jgi:hypothetical protein